MSRNIGSRKCSCGRKIELSDCVTRPLTFEEYINAIGWKDCPYYDEYENLFVAKAICPECSRQYALWLNIYEFRKGGGYDLSWWHSFNDEPCDHCRELYQY